MSSVELENAALLITTLLGSVGVALNLGRARPVTRYAAFLLGLLGAFLLTQSFGAVAGGQWEGAGPGLVISYVLIGSMWASLVVASILVLRRGETRTDSAERAG